MDFRIFDSDVLIALGIFTKSSAIVERRATRYVIKFVLCFTRYGSWKGYKQQK